MKVTSLADTRGAATEPRAKPLDLEIRLELNERKVNAVGLKAIRIFVNDPGWVTDGYKIYM